MIYLDPIDLHIKPVHELVVNYPGHPYKDSYGWRCAVIKYSIRVGAKTREQAVDKALEHIILTNSQAV